MYVKSSIDYSIFRGQAMTSVIPPLTPLRKAKKDDLQSPSPQEGDTKALGELNQGTARMVDTYIYNYPGLVRDNDAAFATVNEDSDVKVAIVGAGFAGATAAYELRRAGVKNITVYEARGTHETQEGGLGEKWVPKIGGRADSRSFQDARGHEYINEMGPMRVPENSKLFWHYLSKLVGPNEDPEQTIFPNPGVVATEMVYRGIRYTWQGGEPPQAVPHSDEAVDWEQLNTDVTESFFGSLVDPDNTTLGDVVDLLQKVEFCPEEAERIKQYWAHFLEKYDDVSFVAALEQYFDGLEGRPDWGATEYNMFSTLGLGTGGFGPLFPVCFLEIFRLLLWEYEQEYSPSLPMQEIVKRLLQFNPETGRVDKNLEPLGETVDYIGYDASNQKVNIHSIDPDQIIPGQRIKQRQYDYVIVATTLRSMQIRMNLDATVPPVSYPNSQPIFGGEAYDMVRESLRIPHIMNSSKLFGFLPQKPWNDSEISNWPKHGDGDIPIKCVLSDTLARQMYFLDPYPNDSEAGTNVLISYNWGDDSIKIMGVQNYNPEQAVNPDANPDFVLKQAYEVGLETTIGNSPVAQSLQQITIDHQDDWLTSVIWQNEPMIFGAFKIDYPNQYYYTSQLVYQYQEAKKSDLDAAERETRRVYLAGNNCSYQGGWIEGAMQSAVNAASAVLKVMTNEGQANNFRMGELFEENPFQSVLNSMENKYKLSPRKVS
jgi:tryptophan 2-monooxygenase